METPPKSEIILYQTEDGRARIECRFEGESIWLTQKLMAELFQKDVRTINEHIQNVFEEGELPPDSVIRKFRITAADGKTYETQHYNLDVVISVGYRVKSARGTQFRIWATAQLKEYLVKGFVMDDGNSFSEFILGWTIGGSARASRAVSSALAGNIGECVRRGVEHHSRGRLCSPFQSPQSKFRIPNWKQAAGLRPRVAIHPHPKLVRRANGTCVSWILKFLFRR